MAIEFMKKLQFYWKFGQKCDIVITTWQAKKFIQEVSYCERQNRRAVPNHRTVHY